MVIWSLHWGWYKTQRVHGRQDVLFASARTQMPPACSLPPLQTAPSHSTRVSQRVPLPIPDQLAVSLRCLIEPRDTSWGAT